MANTYETTNPGATTMAQTPAQSQAGPGLTPPDQRQGHGADLNQKVQELTAHGQELAAEYYQQGREYVTELQQQLEQQVRQKPLQALLMAAGLGLLVGLLRRR